MSAERGKLGLGGIVALVALSGAGGGTGAYKWKQGEVAKLTASLEAIEQASARQEERMVSIEDTMNLMHGALDQCRGRNAWDGMPPDYYRGVEQQKTLDARVKSR